MAVRHGAAGAALAFILLVYLDVDIDGSDCPPDVR